MTHPTLAPNKEHAIPPRPEGAGLPGAASVIDHIQGWEDNYNLILNMPMVRRI